MKKRFDIYKPEIELSFGRVFSGCMILNGRIMKLSKEPRVIDLGVLTKKRNQATIKRVINKEEIWLNNAQFAESRSKKTSTKQGKKSAKNALENCGRFERKLGIGKKRIIVIPALNTGEVD